MLKLLTQFLGHTPLIIESPIKEEENVLGWHCNIVAKTGTLPLGGGCGLTKETSRRIAASEVFERVFFSNLNSTPERSDFLLDRFPTTCGFAAGFESESTKWRAICEALERWCFSRWIDHHFQMAKQSNADIKLSPLAHFFAKPFEKVEFYETPIFRFSGQNLRTVICLAYYQNGVFLGGRCSRVNDDFWTHSLLEANRCLVNYKNRSNFPSSEKKDFYIKRLFYFGSNAAEAQKQVGQATILNWPQPEILLLRQLSTGSNKIYLWRALFSDYVPWDQGDETRFVY